MSLTAVPAAYSGVSLLGKVAFITGGSSGIGAAAVRLFCARGAKVVLAARREAQSNAIVKEVRAAGGECTFVQCDVTKEADVKAAVAACVERYGRLDVAFNNSGAMGPNGPTHEQSPAAVTAILDLNVTAVYTCMKYELEQFARQGFPDPASVDHHTQPNSYHRTLAPYSIINNASIFGLVGLPTYSAYSASKHAVVGLSKSVAKEYAAKGVRVNAVCYGFIVSEITGAMVDFMLPRVPVGRLGQGVEAAECVAFLASDASSFVTGSTLVCDGGVTSCGI